MSASDVTVVVPTLGKSPVLGECLAALRRDGGTALRILVVDQSAPGTTAITRGLPSGIADDLGIERIQAPEPLGFARAVNRGIFASATPWVAVVNDDAIVASPWLAPLVEALEADARAAAAQGVNVGGESTVLDGCGLAWNHRFEAVQLLHGRPLAEAPTEDRVVFGVSATAAVYRRAALDTVATPNRIFCMRLGSYYEDADLACRLRAAGWTSRLVASARCRHLGSSSSTTSERLAQVYRNRYAVLARLLGRGFWPRLPLFALRDLAACARAAASGRRETAVGIVRGLLAAPWRLRGFASLRAPLLPASAVRAASAFLPRIVSPAHSATSEGVARSSSATGDGVASRHVNMDTTVSQSAATPAILEGLVVHWRSPKALDQLIAAWGSDSRFGLIVVDNSGELTLTSRPGLTVVRPGANLGFAGGVNRAFAQARAPYVMLLNPDAHPQRGAVEELARALDEHPEWAGVAPRLLGHDGAPQFAWQLRPLPSPGSVLQQVFFLSGTTSRRAEPEEGTAIPQPAGAALALRRSVLAEVGGLDTSFFPAWFEDVDLAARLAPAKRTLHYWPRAVFVHGLGGSLEALGYGSFLWIYYRNLVRYLRKHHGAAWAAAALVCLPAAALVRALLLPLRRPRRARGRGDALRGLAGLAVGALTGFRAPARLKRSFAAPAEL